MLRIQEEAASAVWQALLSLRRLTKSSDSSPPRTVAVARGGDGWFLAGADAVKAEDVIWVALEGPLSDACVADGARNVADYDHERYLEGQEPIRVTTGSFDPDALAILRMYLPCIVGAYRARRAGRVFVLAHLAQTLDGRIACRNGHSQWISNEANLIHSHRLRALHDAVLVGGRTVALDDPQLTVRHVEGDDPERIVLSATASVLRSEASYKIFADAGCTVLCADDALDGLALNGRHGRVQIVPMACGAGEMITSEGICEALLARGISSIFVEGGGRTLSGFLASGLLDVLHVHVAPVVLGSGISGFQLPEVQTIQAGRRMCMENFSLDGEVLLECRGGAQA